MKKIIFLIAVPFGERNYKRYGIEVLQKNGFEVEVWDFTPFLNPQIHAEVEVPDRVNFGGHRQFPIENDAQAAIALLDRSCFVVALIPCSYETISLYRALSAVPVGYCVVVTNAVPLVGGAQELTSRLARMLQVSPAQFGKALFSRIPFRYLGIRPATVLLAGGERSVHHVSNRPVNHETKILWAHTRDYDLYLDEKDKPVQTDVKLGVFLDENLPFHYEYGSKKQWGHESPCTASEYYPGLCRLFDFLERKHGARIVIAAHPSSHYEDQPDYFRGRPVLRGKTIELVRQAGFVISHSSTAFNFAVLFNKSVLFVTNDEILRSRKDALYITAMASYFHKRPINVDAPFDWDLSEELMDDKEAYARYREAYIKRKDSPEKTTWQILADYLKASDV